MKKKSRRASKYPTKRGLIEWKQKGKVLSVPKASPVLRFPFGESVFRLEVLLWWLTLTWAAFIHLSTCMSRPFSIPLLECLTRHHPQRRPIYFYIHILIYFTCTTVLKIGLIKVKTRIWMRHIWRFVFFPPKLSKMVNFWLCLALIQGQVSGMSLNLGKAFND